MRQGAARRQDGWTELGLREVVVDGRPLVEGKKVTGLSWTEELAKR